MRGRNPIFNRMISFLLRLLCLLFFMAPVGQPGVAEAEEHRGEGGVQRIVAWTYYTYPPFILKGNQGLTHDFMELLNSYAKGKFVFHLEVMPRKRIDLYLEEDEPGIVLFVNPAWMKGFGKTTYQWTSPLFSDRNGIISNVFTKVNYAGPESVRGLKLGGVLGRKYKGLEESIRQGWIVREDVVNEEINILKLCERRIDFMTAPESVLRYLVTQLGVGERIYFSPTPLFEYTRHILVSNGSPDLFAFLEHFTEELPTNPEWLALKVKYQLQ